MRPEVGDFEDPPPSVTKGLRGGRQRGSGPGPRLQETGWGFGDGDRRVGSMPQSRDVRARTSVGLTVGPGHGEGRGSRRRPGATWNGHRRPAAPPLGPLETAQGCCPEPR